MSPRRSVLAAVMVAGSMILNSWSRADEGTAAPPTATADEQRPLMSLLSKGAVGQSLQAARIDVFGYIQGSYQYNLGFSPQPDLPYAFPLNVNRQFDLFQHNAGYVNQIDLAIERKVDLETKQIDFGGRVEANFGSDARFFHANGLLDHERGQNPDDVPFTLGGEYQFDLYQAYVDVGVPVGNGLRLRFGKFAFLRPIDPNASPFYTHSIAAAYTFPYTLTGVSAKYGLSEQLSVEAGLSRGWDQSIKDNNSAIDGFARVTWQPSSESQIIGSIVVGPEMPENNSDYTTLLSLSYAQFLSEKWEVHVDGVFGHQVHPMAGDLPAAEVPTGGPSLGGAGNWFGVTGAVLYTINEFMSAGARLEWYRDDTGYTIGLAGQQNQYEATIGLTITPFANTPLGKNFQVRPELRYDYSSRKIFHLFTSHDQATAAIDAFFNF